VPDDPLHGLEQLVAEGVTLSALIGMALTTSRMNVASPEARLVVDDENADTASVDHPLMSVMMLSESSRRSGVPMGTSLRIRSWTALRNVS